MVGELLHQLVAVVGTDADAEQRDLLVRLLAHLGEDRRGRGVADVGEAVGQQHDPVRDTVAEPVAGHLVPGHQAALQVRAAPGGQLVDRGVQLDPVLYPGHRPDHPRLVGERHDGHRVGGPQLVDERAQGLLGAVVLRGAHVRVDPVQRAKIDDVAAALRQHERERGLHRPVGPVEGDEHRVAELLVGLGLHPSEPTAAPRVVHEHVNGAERVLGGVDHRDDLQLVAHVGAHRDRLGPELVDQLACDALTRARVDLGDNDFRALRREPSADPVPDAVAATGDDRDAPVQTSHRAPFRSRRLPFRRPLSAG